MDFFVLISHLQLLIWLDFVTIFVHLLGNRTHALHQSVSSDGVHRSAFEFRADLSQTFCSKQCPNWVCIFGLGYELIQPLYTGQHVPLQSIADLLAIKAADEDCSVKQGRLRTTASREAVEVIHLVQHGFCHCAPKSTWDCQGEQRTLVFLAGSGIHRRRRLAHVNISR